MAVVRGKDFVLYRNSGTPASPTWVEIENVRDVTRGLEKALADASIRGSDFRLQVGTLKDLSVEFQMVYDDDDADVDALEEAFYDDANVEMMALDGLISVVGSKGLRFMAQVTNFGVNEALEDVGLIDVTLVPGFDSTNLPRRVNVAVAGSVVDTE